MSTEAQIAANRANAQYSTGPRTEEGKAASSQNALTHGLTASTPILPSEDPNAFQSLLQSLIDDLKPTGPLQLQLVSRIASILWKLQRLAPAESRFVSNQVRKLHEHREHLNRNYTSRKERLAVVPLPTLDEVIAGEFQHSNNTLTRLQGYEVRLERSLQSTLRQLRQLQHPLASLKIENTQNEPNSSVNPCQSSTQFLPTPENGNLGKDFSTKC